ncbi:ras GEF [Lophiostoma macrostomum CBS 122681]|uniref:Ras GEF n=1 Tax=Lophiostoma macrostomum CBS 122681 TaxID=1314788 RepID=A0A6A6TRR1_9PLEO|nr:ras GEF [Lophiostoma macrostomum CBS 122681]
MALPALQQKVLPGLPPDTGYQRDVLAASRRAPTPKRTELDGRRTATLRRVKDSKEELRRTRARGASSGTVESSTTNSGRSFTVANINHGIIYLRPVVRPGHQRTRPSPDPFVFPPQTPPDSATLDSRARSSSNDWEQSLYSARTPTRTEAPRLPEEDAVDESPQPRPVQSPVSPPRPIAHVRSRSFSTADDHTLNSQSTEPGTFKVVIERPPFGHDRPKTADTGSLPLLEVPIPHYRLGTPRFSARGTAILRSSVYTRASGTEDIRSSVLTPQRATHSFLSSRPRSDLYSPVSINYRTTMDRMALQPASAPSSARVSKQPIGPQLYDALTANPDDRAVVRFSPSGDILAATPSRLVAHITSPSFLDYELLSDFFLTFRSFLSSRDLAAYLISRLRWAVNRQDDFGRIVRVRTFVALRHWILNYFVDDFVPVYPLRVYFCELVNGLFTDLKARADGGGGDIKIVGELKKCWRRTCALYWESDDGIGKDAADEELLPGGQAGSQASHEATVPNPPAPTTPPRQASRSDKVETIGSNPSDQFASRHMDWAQRARHTPQNSLSTPYIPSQEYESGQVPLSPASEQSMQVLSCSIPMRGLNKNDPTNDMPLYPHPVPHPVPTRFAASPQQSASIKRPNRPSHSHKRSGSFSDALRDNRAPLSTSKNPSMDATITAIANMPGSLVRGGLFQPGSAYIDVKNGGLRHTRSHLELEPVDVSQGDTAAQPGMKKIFGSVRRALSSKQPSASTPHLQGAAYKQTGAPSTRSSNPTIASTNSGGVHKRRYARPRPQVRIDLLASRVEESFREVIKQELKNEQEQHQRLSAKPDLSGFEFEFEKRENTSPNQQLNIRQNEPDPRVYSGVTTGSKSIVIMDDTRPPGIPIMSGALAGFSPEDNPLTREMVSAHQRGASIDERLAEDAASVTRHSEMSKPRESEVPTDWPRSSRSTVQRSIVTQRRSLSEGREQMHSFRRRGSTRTWKGRSMSLRRHASYNSGLSRRNAGDSIATFETMSTDNDPFVFDRSPTSPLKPARQLRRRPGGNLRDVDNVHDLEYMQRPHSTGSVSNRTHSVTNSIILRSDRYVPPVDEAVDRHEEGQNTEHPKEKPISLVDTHSSQPNLRPSFEAEVAKLAALPDDTDDDGGIESALMKLEGRYERKSPDTSPRVTISPETYRPTGLPIDSSNPSYITSDPGSMQSKSYANADDALYRPLAPPEAEGQGMYRLSAENFNRRAPAVQSAVGSEDSYSSIPLLDRGLSDITTSPRSRTVESMRSSAKVAPLNPASPPVRPDTQSTPKLLSPNSSIEYVIETDSMKRIPRNGTVPRSSIPRESFLLDDDEDLSDMADDDSTMGTRSDGTSHGVRSFFDDEPAVVEDTLPTHPMRHPPTPPLTGNRLNDSLPRVDTTVFERGLPTPGLTPTSRLNNQPFGHSSQPLTQPSEPAIELQELKKENTLSPPAHLPFVLAYDSEILAQQFTIVEKDALDEIDWKELIELRWKQSSPTIRDWVQYLRTQEARGVDVVIARFNLVVKWAVSECLLTEAIEERARCIVKYIHIAAHARRLRNYATMYQITIALLSSDVARLKRTWALVPAAELQTMKELEALVQPLRNFHNLRVEMETATVEEGCIPFIGIYTRDLIYNAQKPAFIDAPPVDGERLVNFERQHTAAMIVKSLLRLLEASSKYTFKPEPNIVSKCLWMAALGDDELTALSRTYE